MSVLRMALVLSAIAGTAPAFPASSHAQRVVYIGGGPTRSGLFISDADGRDERPLIPMTWVAYNPSFSADGTWIVFTSERFGSADIFRVHPTGSGVERLTASPAFDDQGALSPDGRSLAFVSTRAGGTANIWLLDLARHRYFNLTKSNRGNFRPSWSPDGKWIAFTSDRDRPHGRFGPDRSPPRGSGCCGWELVQSTALYIVHPDGSGLRRLTPAGRFAGSPKWSPDGRHIVYYFDDRTLAQKQARSDAVYQIVSVDIVSGAKQIRTSGPGLKKSPQYIGANRIAYLTWLDGKTSLADTSGWKGPPEQIANPSWSPDGKRLVFRVLGSEQGLRILSLQDGKITKLTTQWDNFPAWSPRGDRILFTGLRTGDFEIYTIRPDGSGLRQLTHDHGNDAHAIWSPDGRSILFTSSRMGWKDETPGGGQSYGEVFAMRADGTHSSQLTDDQWEESADAWLPPQN